MFFEEDTAIDTKEDILKVMSEKERMALEASVRDRIERISELIAERSYDKAEELIIPLEKFEFCRSEVAMLRHMLAFGRRDQSVGIDETLTERRLMRETEEQLSMPSTYGKTIVIDSKLDPLELPQGKMEDLINRKVTMNLESATVGMLVDFLNENGLNVIADDALSSEKTLTMKLTDVPLKEVFSYIARNMGIAFYIGENMVWITAGEETTGPRLETRILRLRQGFIPTVPGGGKEGDGGGGGAADTELEDVLSAFLEGGPEGSSFQIFRTRNIIVVRNTRENIRFVEQIIREFDKPPAQVIIEARFVTVGQDDLRDIGVQITQMAKTEHDKIGLTERGRLRESNFLTNLGKLDEANGLGALTVSGVIGKRMFDVLISAIDSKETSVTLSVPRVTVMNNRTARIRKGDKIYYFEEYDLESIDHGDEGSEERLVPSGDPVELPIGITFDVNVNIGNDGKTVMLGLHPEIVNFIKWEDYLSSGSDDDDSSSSSEGSLTQIKLPRTHEQSVLTTVGVESGETVVLGGLVERSKKNTLKKVPFLGDIPLLGYFFRRTVTEVLPTNLLIFVTATVVNDRGEYVKTMTAPVKGAK